MTPVTIPLTSCEYWAIIAPSFSPSPPKTYEVRVYSDRKKKALSIPTTLCGSLVLLSVEYGLNATISSIISRQAMGAIDSGVSVSDKKSLSVLAGSSPEESPNHVVIQFGSFSRSSTSGASILISKGPIDISAGTSAYVRHFQTM